MFVITTILAFLAVVQGAKTSWKELDNYSFEKYVEEFNLKFSAAEIDSRRKIFETELARVKAHNAKSLSWKEGVSKFSHMTEQEKKTYRGRSKGAAKHGKMLKNSKPHHTTDFKSVSELPTNVDWRGQGIVTAVKDQGHCGSCWAFASTAVVESYVAKATGLLFDLSVQQMAMCAPNPDHCGGAGGCAGSTAELAFEYVTSSTGLYQEYQYPYESYGGVNYNCSIPSGAAVATINGYVKLTENNYEALMNAVATLGPIAVSVDASSWSGYESGIYDGCNQKNPDIDHAVVLMGYGEENGQKFWLIRNSWSPAWGEAGYIRLARSDNEEEKCGSDITPQDGTACAGQNDPVTVCGTCGVLYDSAYPLNAAAL